MIYLHHRIRLIIVHASVIERLKSPLKKQILLKKKRKNPLRTFDYCENVSGVNVKKKYNNRPPLIV